MEGYKSTLFVGNRRSGKTTALVKSVVDNLLEHDHKEIYILTYNTDRYIQLKVLISNELTSRLGQSVRPITKSAETITFKTYDTYYYYKITKHNDLIGRILRDCVIVIDDMDTIPISLYTSVCKLRMSNSITIGSIDTSLADVSGHVRILNYFSSLEYVYLNEGVSPDNKIKKSGIRLITLRKHMRVKVVNENHKTAIITPKKYMRVI